jgi:hypothetical protein
MPYAGNFTKRIVIGKKAFEEMKDLYIAYKISPEILNKMEYISDFKDLQDKLENL